MRIGRLGRTTGLRDRRIGEYRVMLKTWRVGALGAMGTLTVPGMTSGSVILNGLFLKIDILCGQVLLNM